jgi:3-hydroxyacyl-CoA dehydrogenase
MQSTAATPSRSEVRQVGFIGLGEMGGAIAMRMVGAGFPMRLWARRPEVLGAFAGPQLLRTDVVCLTTQAAQRECSIAPRLTHAAKQGVERLGLPPGWKK